MYLKSITLDGFKSYGQRTIISGFDPFFNAITGLNGSGKSNILDSICFLLGITNLSQVRATNLQELVYKNGQAGITKASVSITFDNTKRDQSPIGYDQYDEITVTRQIIIGGQNKYLINGCTATNTRVKDLFQSVQLNVNNPHFLIMQGRITKVLNMKPIEILSMIEEAAGTKMYETKKQASQRTIEIKDSKLREINSLLAEEITPTLTRLKEERAAFLEYQKIQRELEHLTKLCIAYQYVTAEEASQKSKEDLTTAKDNMQELQARMAALEEQSKELEASIEKLFEKRSEESMQMLANFQKDVKKCELDHAKILTAVTNKKDTMKSEEKKIVSLNKQKSEDCAVIKTKEDTLNALVNELEAFKITSDKDANSVKAAEKHFQAVSSGMSSNDDGKDATLAEQLITAKTEIATAETEMKQADMTLKHLSEELKKKEVELKKTATAYEVDTRDLGPLQKAIERIETELKALNYEEGHEEQLTNQRQTLQQQVYRLSNRYEDSSSKFPQLAFEYTNPTPNFDRNKVKGVLCNLFKVKDPRFATALEVVAGGRLYNVVVDNEETGKLLLSKGNLRKRHTIIPLNKISAYPIAPNVIKRAEALVGKETVCTALSLVSYPSYLKSAMEFVFGNTLVCLDPTVAKTVAFDKGVQKRTVTLDGDVYDPAGTLTGGSRRPGDPFLTALIEIKQIKSELDDAQNQFANVKQQLTEVGKVAAKYNDLKQQLEMNQRQIELVNERLKHTVHHQILEEVNGLRQSIGEQNESLARCKAVVDKNTKKVKSLETKIKNFKSVHEAELKEAESNMKKCKQVAETSLKVVKEKEQAIDELRLELEELQNGLGNYEEQVQAVEAVRTDLLKELQEMERNLEEEQEKLEVAKANLSRQKELLKSADEEIANLQMKDSELKKNVNNGKLYMKELQQKLVDYENAVKEATSKMQDLIKHYDWIYEEKKYFGQPNTAYDFSANDPKVAQTRMQKMREKKEELSKSVNTRAMAMLERTEEQYNDLVKKKEIVENDKLVIKNVIKELDEKKREALQTAWVKVNQDFGSIFSTLLPGTQAKLVPLEGKSVLDGLEVKVAFGNKWKESLNELSGGQRSLVALSIILALLLFKPAPIYILDEVDAALDLSHTQNIGNMLRTHFKHSQFIIVSLKDGMFNNANVLFKTKFVDGMSTVSRHTQSQSGK